MLQRNNKSRRIRMKSAVLFGLLFAVVAFANAAYVPQEYEELVIVASSEGDFVTVVEQPEVTQEDEEENDQVAGPEATNFRFHIRIKKKDLKKIEKKVRDHVKISGSGSVSIPVGTLSDGNDIQLVADPEEQPPTADLFRFKIRISKKHFKKIERAVRKHVNVSGSASVSFPAPMMMDPVELELLSIPEDHIRETSNYDVHGSVSGHVSGGSRGVSVGISGSISF
ncbi:uncharacterized protein [Prorops nasuta]|uniref:uncharacterized protein n=1 Tax=Prorops nasuta TaxID=863751 RepID=UPI0034CF0B02